MERLRTAVTWLRERPTVTDVLLTAFLLAIVVPACFSAEAEGSERDIDAWAVALTFVATLPLLRRRQFAVAVLTVSALATFTYWVADYPDIPLANALVLAVYSVAVHAATRRRSMVVGAVFAGALFTVLVAGIVWPEEDVGMIEALGNTIIFAAAWAFGDNLRHRRAYLDEVERRMEQSEARAGAEAQEAIATERTRIARDLHDVVAHSMSVMVVQAAAARRIAASDPSRARAAMETVETTGRESLAEMRRILGVLRNGDESAALAPQPGLGDLQPLAASCVAAGLGVTVEVCGTHRELPSGIELTAYRIVQESLTNSLKHGGPSTSASVTIDYRSGELAIRIVDDGRGVSADRGSHADVGHGMQGMRERVEAYRGELRAGPRTGGGYEVAASLPLAAPG